MQYQFHFEKKFYLDKKTGYWISTTCPKIRAHVHVWKTINGIIPKGMHVHHVDENKSNNEISNLRLLKSSEHLAMHMTVEKREMSRIRMHTIVRPKADVWHGSKEGIEWHKKHAFKCQFGHFDLTQIDCESCKEIFKPKTHHQKFCSNKCKSRWRRKQKIDDIPKKCIGCGVIFKANKYVKKRKFCSLHCNVKNKVHQKA